MNPLEKFKDIRTFLFDVDGVLTNSELLVLEDGKLLRKMSTRDGYALKMAVQAGYRVAIITGGKSAGVVERLKNLGVPDVYYGISDKLETFQEYVELYEIDPEDVLYMGDDVPDFAVMRRVGLPACPSDAAREILDISHYISPYAGGAGCVRDVIEKVMRLHGKWPKTE